MVRLLISSGACVNLATCYYPLASTGYDPTHPCVLLPITEAVWYGMDKSVKQLLDADAIGAYPAVSPRNWVLQLAERSRSAASNASAFDPAYVEVGFTSPGSGTTLSQQARRSKAIVSLLREHEFGHREDLWFGVRRLLVSEQVEERAVRQLQQQQQKLQMALELRAYMANYFDEKFREAKRAKHLAHAERTKAAAISRLSRLTAAAAVTAVLRRAAEMDPVRRCAEEKAVRLGAVRAANTANALLKEREREREIRRRQQVASAEEARTRLQAEQEQQERDRRFEAMIATNKAHVAAREKAKAGELRRRERIVLQEAKAAKARVKQDVAEAVPRPLVVAETRCAVVESRAQRRQKQRQQQQEMPSPSPPLSPPLPLSPPSTPPAQQRKQQPTDDWQVASPDEQVRTARRSTGRLRSSSCRALDESDANTTMTRGRAISAMLIEAADTPRVKSALTPNAPCFVPSTLTTTLLDPNAPCFRPSKPASAPHTAGPGPSSPRCMPRCSVTPPVSESTVNTITSSTTASINSSTGGIRGACGGRGGRGGRGEGGHVRRGGAMPALPTSTPRGSPSPSPPSVTSPMEVAYAEQQWLSRRRPCAEVAIPSAGNSIDCPRADSHGTDASHESSSSSSSWSLPAELECPISHELMLDPVLTCDGETYERSAIEEWLAQHSTSPLTGQPLAETSLVPNVMVRNITHRLLHAAACTEERRGRPGSLGQGASR